MDTASVIQSQYLAALAMLEQAVQKCPPPLWDHGEDKNPFWRVAFHVLFYTHLYLQPTEGAYVPWEKHRNEAQYFGPIAWNGGRDPIVERPYTQAEILEYLDFCREQVQQLVPQQDYNAPSGFEWLPFSKLELQLYNIRHLQHHAGELYDRLGQRAGVDMDWVGMWPLK